MAYKIAAERRKNLDRFDALGVKRLYALKRKKGEREHQLRDQSAPYSRRMLPASADRYVHDSVRAGGTEHD
jgi:hypothetical protein